ncbi:MAG: CPBP family intramembrane metalloprotease [Clostridia bacterium]|nr:CPBP family intramembrane metalloprotease [Clostridia bacterium]
MKKQTQKDFLILGADGGSAFTISVFSSLIITLVFAVILIASGLAKNEQFTSSSVYTYLSYFLSSVSLFLCLAYFIKRKNLDFAMSVGIRRCEKKYYLLAILVLFGSLFGLSGLNDLFIEFLSGFGYEAQEIVLPKNNFGDFILCFIIICALPAILEECLFRGIILNSTKRLGDLFCIIISGILFSLFHHSPVQTVYQFIMGVTFALLTVKSGSILPAMLFHFLNNLYIVVYYFLAPEGFAFAPWLTVVLCVSGVIAYLFGAFYLIFKCEKPKVDADLNAEFAKSFDINNERKSFILFALAGILGCVVLWIVNLFPSA